MSARRRRYHSPLLVHHIHPQLLFVTGAACVVLYLLQDNLPLRLLQVALFGVLATMNGKRIMWGYFAVMVGSITVFHLFQPAGEVLLRIGRFAVTRGAMHTGAFKGLTIIGLVFISLFSIRPNLRLPGNFGGLLAKMLWYFERIFEHRKGVSLNGFFQSVDGVLQEIFPLEQLLTVDDPVTDGAEQDPEPPATTVSGYVFCSMIVVVNAAFIPMSGILR